MSSGSGITATVAADVCTRPCASVSGTRWTRCPPLSNCNSRYAPSPSIERITSLNPPRSEMLESITSNFQPLISAYRRYISNKSRANNAASSPPVPARTSITHRVRFASSPPTDNSNNSSQILSRSSRIPFVSSSAICRSSGSAEANIGAKSRKSSESFL